MDEEVTITKLNQPGLLHTLETANS